ncbi:MAG: hypothetical protein NZM37_09780, partial [Sandaracinaceae bacterium]|nr:hypothetical protein [Sandaracinaceae bacterium]MDW8246939.1 hypothetical protein [Sandaracinaceae bacterium]
HFQLGLLHGKKGNLFRAIEELETALQISGANFSVLRNLAILYQRAGFRRKAIEAWEHAMERAPDQEMRVGICEHIKSLIQ